MEKLAGYQSRVSLVFKIPSAIVPLALSQFNLSVLR